MRELTAYLGCLLVAMALVLLPGCDGGGTAANTDKVAKVARTIKLSTGAATSIGLVAIPDAAEADNIATQALKVVNENVLPILAGDEAGLVAGLARLRDLSVFDKPGLEKFKLLLSTALPLLEANLPDDLVDKATSKVPADVKAYLDAFFGGVKDGCDAYLGHGDAPRGGAKWTEIRAKLAKK